MRVQFEVTSEYRSDGKCDACSDFVFDPTKVFPFRIEFNNGALRVPYSIPVPVLPQHVSECVAIGQALTRVLGA